MLGRTPNLADPTARTSSKAQMEMSRTMLRRGKGAAFLVQPSSGMLQPFSEQLVEVTGFSDTWGEYKDILNCQVSKARCVNPWSGNILKSLQFFCFASIHEFRNIPTYSNKGTIILL